MCGCIHVGMPLSLVMNYMHRMHILSGMARPNQSATFCFLVLGLTSIICGVSCAQMCSPQTLPGSHSVHAYDEQPRRCLAGCIGAASPDIEVAEVHVINLRSSTSSSSTTNTSTSTSSTDSASELQNLVNLHFQPKQAGFFARSLVFVLNSATPVWWKVEGDSMFSIPFYTIKIVVPHHSCQSDHVRWNSEISLSVSIVCSSLPQNNSDLLSFIQDLYGSASTFSEVLNANAIGLLVGSGIRNPSACDIKPDFQTPDLTARHILDQPITGCQTEELPSPLQPEFHIILLHASTGARDMSTGEPPHVAVTLQPARTTDSTCNIILVLVSETNVTWTINAGRRRGTLQVMSPNPVDMQEDLMNQLQRREFPRNAAGLLTWAEMEDWPLTTFSRAESANEFIITLEHKNAPTREPPSRESIIKQYTEKDCHRNGITLRMLRRAMNIFQLSAGNMMLRDHSCKAVESGDYYIIDTQLDQCGTTVTVMDTGQVVYHNEVIFSNSESVLEGSGASDLERLMGGVPVDDEQSLTTRVPFTCEYSSSGNVLPSPDNLSGQYTQKIRISMDMYMGNRFTKKQTTFPLDVQPGERVYFEVALHDTYHLEIVPTQCWLSNGLGLFTKQLHMLIANGCARDESVIFHKDLSDGQVRHFSYETPDLEWHTDYNIHCELGICSKNRMESNSRIPLCVDILDPASGCIFVNKLSGLALDLPTQSLYLGPYRTLPLLTTMLNENVVIRVGSDCTEDLNRREDCEAEGLGTGPAAAIAIASFVMGMVLMGALWFIHTHTGPHTGPPPSPSPCTVSTASSPSANGHLMNGHIPNGIMPNGAVPNGVVPNGTTPNGAIPNRQVPSGFLSSKLNPNGIPLQGLRHVNPLPEDV